MNESDNLSLQEESHVSETSSFSGDQESSPHKVSDDPDSSHPTHEKEALDRLPPQLVAFIKSFESETNIDKKLQFGIDFMRSSLEHKGIPHFKSFWEARKHCLPLFKETIAVPLRTQLWHEFSELSKEARRLKDLLDEQSSFAIEQIGIAIDALEADVKDIDASIQKSPVSENLVFPSYLSNQKATYEHLQKYLNFLNVQASRINALRKELLKNEMRVRQKNQFFQRLSHAGDAVFPKRKELIKEISDLFASDVKNFIDMHFGDTFSNEPFYHLREEIKCLQSLAKSLTLNTSSFSETRTNLSLCWDKIKSEEKEKKKEFAQKKSLFRQNEEEIQQRLQLINESMEKGELSQQEIIKKIDEVTSHMRKVDLGREELRHLRGIISGIRDVINKKVQHEEAEKQQKEKERLLKHQSVFLELKSNIQDLFARQEILDLSQLTEEKDLCLKQIADSILTKAEKQDLERELKPFKEIIIEKQEKSLLELSEDDRQSLQQLQDLLQQRKARRQEIKTVLESYRKSAGCSLSDFEKALSLTSQINEGKEKLEKIDDGIKEVEQKIKKLQLQLTGKKG